MGTLLLGSQAYSMAPFGAGVPTSDVARFAGTSVTMLETTYHYLRETSAEAARLRLDAFDERRTAEGHGIAECRASIPGRSGV